MNSNDPLDNSATADPVAAIDAPPAPAPALHLHPRLLAIWIGSALTVVLPVMLVAWTISLFASRLQVGALASCVGVLVISVITLHGRAYIARFQCRLLPDGLWVHRGVLWRSEIFVPRSRIQHTEVQQGPLARRFGIANLKVYTAGTSHGEIGIDGLPQADALWLRDELLGRHGHDGV